MVDNQSKVEKPHAQVAKGENKVAYFAAKRNNKVFGLCKHNAIGCYKIEIPQILAGFGADPDGGAMNTAI